MFSKSPFKKVATLKAFVDAILELREEPAINGEQWFFRGQANSKWDVRPSIFREDKLESEHLVIEQAERQNPEEFKQCSNNYELLTKLQHYGLGTRLLDVTLNPLVALFFASEYHCDYTKNKNGQYSKEECDGIVYYCFTRGSSLKELHTKISLAIPFMEFGKSLSLEAFCEHLVKTKTIDEADYDLLCENDFSEIIRMLQMNSFIITTNSNARLIQQRGAFLLSPCVNISTNTEVKSSILSKAKMNLEREFKGAFVVPAKNKEKIREELDFFNVNEATLFPELEHQMRYIQSQAKNPVGTVETFITYHRSRISHIKSHSVGKITLRKIEKIVKESLNNVSQSDINKISKSIYEETRIIDWFKKESSLSAIRRVVTKNIVDYYSAVDAQSKAEEIVASLLK